LFERGRGFERGLSPPLYLTPLSSQKNIGHQRLNRLERGQERGIGK
jgi:hypothetical protein